MSFWVIECSSPCRSLSSVYTGWAGHSPAEIEGRIQSETQLMSNMLDCACLTVLTSASVMDTRLVSMVGCRAMRVPLSCSDSFLSESRRRWELLVLGVPALEPLGGVMWLAAMFMAATRSSSSPLCSESSSALQTVSALMVARACSLIAGRRWGGLVEEPEDASRHWKVRGQKWRHGKSHTLKSKEPHDTCMTRLDFLFCYIHEETKSRLLNLRVAHQTPNIGLFNARNSELLIVFNSLYLFITLTIGSTNQISSSLFRVMLNWRYISLKQVSAFRKFNLMTYMNKNHWLTERYGVNLKMHNIF